MGASVTPLEKLLNCNHPQTNPGTSFLHPELSRILCRVKATRGQLWPTPLRAAAAPICRNPPSAPPKRCHGSEVPWRRPRGPARAHPAAPSLQRTGKPHPLPVPGEGASLRGVRGAFAFPPAGPRTPLRVPGPPSPARAPAAAACARPRQAPSGLSRGASRLPTVDDELLGVALEVLPLDGAEAGREAALGQQPVDVLELAAGAARLGRHHHLLLGHLQRRVHGQRGPGRAGPAGRGPCPRVPDGRAPGRGGEGRGGGSQGPSANNPRRALPPLSRPLALPPAAVPRRVSAGPGRSLPASAPSQPPGRHGLEARPGPCQGLGRGGGGCGQAASLQAPAAVTPAKLQKSSTKREETGKFRLPSFFSVYGICRRALARAGSAGSGAPHCAAEPFGGWTRARRLPCPSAGGKHVRGPPVPGLRLLLLGQCLRGALRAARPVPGRGAAPPRPRAGNGGAAGTPHPAAAAVEAGRWVTGRLCCRRCGSGAAGARRTSEPRCGR